MRWQKHSTPRWHSWGLKSDWIQLRNTTTSCQSDYGDGITATGMVCECSNDNLEDGFDDLCQIENGYDCTTIDPSVYTQFVKMVL